MSAAHCCFCDRRMPRGSRLNGSDWVIQKPKGMRPHRACPAHKDGLEDHVNGVLDGTMKCPTPVPPVVPARAPERPTPQEPPELPMERVAALRAEAIAWSRENGLVGELVADEPARVAYPVWGHGWVVAVRELGGSQKTATARFDAAGRQTYWSTDKVLA